MFNPTDPGDLKGMLMYIRHTGVTAPRLHPNGFIQLNLNGEGTTRLHVWPHPAIPAQKTSHPIHDHSFAMHSTVIAGALDNLTYHFTRVGNLEATHQLYRAERIGPEETILAPTGEYGTLLPGGTQFIQPGKAYDLAAGLLHDSRPHNLTATIMKKINPVSYNPAIAVPVGVEPDNNFRRTDVDLDMLWAHIDEAINLAQSSVTR